MELKSDNYDENRDCKWKTKSDDVVVESGAQNGKSPSVRQLAVPRCNCPAQLGNSGCWLGAVLYFTESGSVGTPVPSHRAK